MAKRKNALSRALETKAKDKGAKVVESRRSGTVLVAAHFIPAVQKCLKQIALNEDTTVQAVLADAINMAFAQRGLPQIANSTNAAATVQPEAEVGVAQ